MSVVCGACTKSLGRCIGAQVRHETVQEVRDCYTLRYAPGPYLTFEDEYEFERCCSLCDAPGHGYPGGGPCPLEMRGWEDTYAEEQWERSRGVVSFEAAYASHMGV